MNLLPNVGRDVLDFYRQLPFNVAGSPAAVAAQIARCDPLGEYPPLARVLNPRMRTLDVGCGGGWLANAIAWHRSAPVLGIDFNPVAVEFAAQVSAALGRGARFQKADLFEFAPAQPFDVVVSLGVLHHTGNCLGALRHLCRKAVAPGGFLFVGLYHRHGRRPFLDHFAAMRDAGADEAAMLTEFSRLFGGQSLDGTHLRSWFRDQVLHPHETQHTQAECAEILATENFALLASSLDDYARIGGPTDLEAREQALENTACAKLREGRYYPGFFCFLARRKA